MFGCVHIKLSGIGFTCCITRVGRVMCSALVQVDACRETNATFEPIFLDKSPCSFFDIFHYFSHCHTGPNMLPSVLPHQAMYFSSTTYTFIGLFRVFLCQFFQLLFLLWWRPISIAVVYLCSAIYIASCMEECTLVFVLLYFADRIMPVREDFG